MKYTTLADTDIRVSKICVGCMSFGDPTLGHHSWTLKEEDTRSIIQHALKKGINFFDTAMAYQGGTSEEYVGRALKDYAKREDVVIATKFSPRSDEEIKAGVSGQQHVLNMLKASLKRLGCDDIDLYICHMWDYRTPIEEIMEGLHMAVTSGKVKTIGISNAYAWQLEKANMIAQMHGWTTFTSMQGHYNLIFREEEREMLPLCREENIVYTPYSPLASGRLARHDDVSTKRLTEDDYAKGKYDKTKQLDDRIIKRVEELAHKHHTGMAQISLAWLLEKGTLPIIGATKLHHIDDAVNALELKLTEEELAYLQEPYQPHELVGVMKDNH